MFNGQQNLLTDFDLNLMVRASSGKRLANYLIDLIGFYITMFILGAMIAIVSPAAIDEFANEDGFGSLSRWVGIICYVLYMFSMEVIFKGKSLGKMITGTRAVNADGSQITVSTALLRGLVRIVPFEPFSALGSPSHPWHDRWTKTNVIDEKASIKSR